MTDPILIATTRLRAQSLLEFLSKQWIGYGDRGVAVQQLCRDIEQALKEDAGVKVAVTIDGRSIGGVVVPLPPVLRFTQGSDPGDEHATLTVREEQARGDDR